MNETAYLLRKGLGFKTVMHRGPAEIVQQADEAVLVMEGRLLRLRPGDYSRGSGGSVQVFETPMVVAYLSCYHAAKIG